MAEQGAAVKRRTRAMLHPEWVSIVRRRGVLGLVEGTGAQRERLTQQERGDTTAGSNR
jgi:hypothetical protein